MELFPNPDLKLLIHQLITAPVVLGITNIFFLLLKIPKFFLKNSYLKLIIHFTRFYKTRITQSTTY